MRMSIIIILCCVGIVGFSQSRLYSKEFSVLTDNDVFFFRDYYYTAGQDLAYKKLVDSTSHLFKTLAKSDTSKILLTYKFGIKLFTPRGISQTEISQMDRPYAGYDYLSIGIKRFDLVDRGFSFSMDLGLVGESSRLGQVQSWWHKILKLRAPKGWALQIRDEVVFNFNYRYWKSWRLKTKFDVVSTSSINAGTASNKLSQDLTFRVLNFKTLKESNFSGSFLSKNSRKSGEIFFFGGIGFDYVVSNIFIEGSLFCNDKSPFVVDALPIIFRQHIGLIYSTPKWTYSSTITHLSKEVAGGIDHVYGSLDIGFRF
jgi:lipid A 3-O-deacylase